MKELNMIMNDDGVFEEYDDTYDLTIHCTSQEEQDEVLLRLNKTVEQLPPVKLEPKTGHWIKKRVDGRGIHHGFCSNCDYNVEQRYDSNYCPNCGAKMVEPQERSDKE